MASQLLCTNPRGSKPLNPNARAFQPTKPLKIEYLPHHLYETEARTQLLPPATTLPISFPLLRNSGFGCYSAQFYHQPPHFLSSSIRYGTPDLSIPHVHSEKGTGTVILEDLKDSSALSYDRRKVSGVAVKKVVAPRLKTPRSSMKVDEKGSSVWMARKFLNVDSCGDNDLSPPTDNNALKVALSGKTTVMMRNIPNKMSREDLLQLLDECCQLENKNAEMQRDSLRVEYDFVYLPMDFRYRCSNKGYAFVNFTTDAAALRICKHLDKNKWEPYGTKKICEVTGARIQGKEALMEHFQRTVFECNTDDYLPVVLSPPRDGLTAVTTPRTVGRRGIVSNRGIRKC